MGKHSTPRTPESVWKEGGEERCNIRFRRNDYVMSAELLYFVKITFLIFKLLILLY
jgi:hypothetical protein